jgi:predicted tellurium resistance membrane protein TerC
MINAKLVAFILPLQTDAASFCSGKPHRRFNWTYTSISRVLNFNYVPMDWISDPTVWSALAALLTLEIVLGVDNVVFISILASKLPIEEQEKARKIGLLAAGGMRLLLLLAVGWVITAVGMTTYVWVMVIAFLTAVGIMLLASKGIYNFVNAHPSVKMLALAFLMLIGTTLIAEGFGQKIPKGYIYAAMTFSVFVEVLNIGIRRKAHVQPLHLREPIVDTKAQPNS